MVKVGAIHVAITGKKKGGTQASVHEMFGIAEEGAHLYSTAEILAEEEQSKLRIVAGPLDSFKKFYKKWKENMDKKGKTDDYIKTTVKFYKLKNRLLLPLFWRFTPFTYRLSTDGKYYADKDINNDFSRVRIVVTDITKDLVCAFVFEFPDEKKAVVVMPIEGTLDFDISELAKTPMTVG